MIEVLATTLAVILIVIVVKYCKIKRELDRFASIMNEIHGQCTNRQLDIGIQQPQVARLAIAVNDLYEDINAERATHRAAINEAHNGMANISHDLRTPLTSVLGYLKLLKDANNTEEQNIYYLDVALRKAQDLSQLVENLFELAKLESGGYAFEFQRLDAVSILAEELAASYAQMSEHDISPEVELPDVALWIVGDKNALQRIFANLLQNMVKHGREPMHIRCITQDKTVCIEFSNKADGIKNADIPKLFQRFFTADRMRSGKNTGLGLAIVKDFIEHMNGEIEVSLRGDKLTFSLSFPLVA